MLTETEVKNLEVWTGKFFTDAQKDRFNFDIHAEIDKTLSSGENKSILREKIKILLGEFSDVENMKKKEAEVMTTEQYTFHLNTIKKEQEKQAKLEFENSLEQIGKQKETLLLEQKFYLLREYVKMVCAGNQTGLVIQGEAGLGKSYSVLKTLKESGREFVYATGYTTPLQLYQFIYDNREKIIFFDDTKNIFKSEAGLEILKAALYSPTGTRLVRYNSSTTKLSAPSEFVFEGGIVVAVNDLNRKNSEDLKAVIDRVLYYEVKFSYEEKLQIIADLIKMPYKDLLETDRKAIFDFLRNNTSPATTNINFRLLFKLFEIFRYDKIQFEKLARELIFTDELTELTLNCLKKHSVVKEAEREFCEKTGFSGRYFYKIKAKINA